VQFDKLTVQGAYDFRLLSPSVIFKALERGLLPELYISLVEFML
jgi:hypothetical protein